MSNIKGMCFTNIEGISCPVTNFVAVPRIGEKVKVNIIGRAYEAHMSVVSVIHTEKDGVPYIKVELWDKSFIRT